MRRERCWVWFRGGLNESSRWVGGFQATTDAERVQMDALINHLLGVQMLHRMFVAEDVPALARREADRLGWRVLMPV